MRIDLCSSSGLCSGTLVANDLAHAGPLLVCIHGGGCNARYFEIAASSTLAQARERGLPVLLINRPGYGGNPVPPGSCPVADSIAPIRSFIDEVRSTRLPQVGGIAIIGHSIGGAAALMLAASAANWPLLGVAVSGIGETRARPMELPAMPLDTKGPLPETLPAELFFGPPATFAWSAVAKLRRASEPWVLSEIAETVTAWPVWWREHAADIEAPVHLRLAEFEAIWETGEVAVASMAARLIRSRRVDAALLRDGGHLYELHHHGPALVASQLCFLTSCSSR